MQGAKGSACRCPRPMDETCVLFYVKKVLCLLGIGACQLRVNFRKIRASKRHEAQLFHFSFHLSRSLSCFFSFKEAPTLSGVYVHGVLHTSIQSGMDEVRG